MRKLKNKCKRERKRSFKCIFILFRVTYLVNEMIPKNDSD